MTTNGDVSLGEEAEEGTLVAVPIRTNNTNGLDRSASWHRPYQHSARARIAHC